MKLLISLAVPLTLSACATTSPVGGELKPTIFAQRMSEDVKTLASEPFGGRAPGTAGETRTIDWLTSELQKIGLDPGGLNGSWTQTVPMVRTHIGAGTMSAEAAGKDVALVQGRDVYVSTLQAKNRIAIANAPLVFVGYGIAASERQWDDFKGVDLKGKVAVFLVNDPDFEALAGEPAEGKFGGRRMTYYGRWTYKFEEAARRGAVAALIVHDSAGAGYGWDTVTAPAGENYDIANAPRRLELQGWIHGDAATRLFAASGLDLAEQRRAARSPAFQPIPLAGAFSADLPVAFESITSRNVLAKIPGTVRPDEVVMFGAHWDAYGIGATDAQGRTIRPGANDDALGVAGLLEIARALKRERPPERSVVFGFWTGEERGLLGSETYALDPVYPAPKTVANITLDILQTGGASRDVMLVGQGQNSLEDDLARAAAAQGRVVTPETLPERGLFYRADHFSLAKRGVPTLLFMAISGVPDLEQGGREAGQRWFDEYMRCYHQTCDAWSADMDFAAAAQDVALAYSVGRGLAKSDVWPQWKSGSEFRQVRINSQAQN